MKRHISRQKLYEEAILKTYEHEIGTQSKMEVEQMVDVPNNFPELMLKRALFGFKDNIPKKHPFDELGFSYIEQLVGMAFGMDDYEFTCHLFEFMEAYPKYFDFNSQDQFDVLYDFYWQSSTENRDFFQRMGDFILRHYDRNLKGYDKAVSIAYSLSGVYDISLTELVNIRRSLSGLEPVEDLCNSVFKIIKGEK